jgi:hypothetical protein
MHNELVFTAYNRPHYLEESVNSWNQVRSLRSWNTTFHVEPSNLETYVADAAMKLNTNVTIFMNPEKLGVLVNPFTAIDTAFANGADFVVLAEDDVIVSQDTLEFFEWASIEYQTVRSILCLNAFSRIGGGKPNQIIRDTTFSPLVWGIWRDRWETHLRDTWDKDYSSGNEDGSEAGWDWNINRIIAANDLRVLKPLQSRSDHIGQYAGTHMTPDLFENSKGVGFELTRGRQRYNEI